MNPSVDRRQTTPMAIVGAILVGLGVAALIGWMVQWGAVTAVQPHTLSMQPLTAVEFILVGMACHMITRRHHHAAAALGGAVTILGLAVLAKTVFQLPQGPDHILFPEASRHHPQSINVAFAFVLAGSMLCITVSRWRYRFPSARSLAIFIIMMSLLTLITALLGVSMLPSSLTVINMAIPTALGFLLLGSVFLINFGRLLQEHLRKRVVWLFFVLCLAILVTSSFGYKSVQRLATAQEELQKRVDFQTALNGILTDTLSIETGQRGYLLTGDPAHLLPYTKAYASVGHEIEELNRLSAGDKQQRELVQQLIVNLEKKDTELKQTIHLQQEGRTNEALDIVRSNVGQKYEDEIRSTLTKLQRNEDISYNTSLAAAHQSVRQTTTLIVLASAINIFLIAIILQLILQEAADRARRQHELEDTLKLAESRRKQNEALLSSIGDGVFAVDKDGQVILFNKAAAAITGFNSGEIIGKHYGDVLSFSTATSNRPSVGFITRALKGKKTRMSNHAVVRHKRGHAVPVADSAAPIIEADGLVTGAIVVFRDVTQEYAVEKAKDEFMALASHQLRTPATGVKQYLSMLRDGYGGVLSGRQAEMVRKAYSSNERQLQIVEDMLNVASIDAGRMTLHSEPTNLSGLLEDVVAEHHSIFESRRQHLNLQLPDSDITITADPQRLRMAIENIINNASKYTPEGGDISVRLSRRARSVVVAVTDTGVGIEARHFKTLFQKFARINNHLSTKVGGSGLGLYLAHHIIQLHNGSIEVTSQPGTGTTFVVTLPNK